MVVSDIENKVVKFKKYEDIKEELKQIREKEQEERRIEFENYENFKLIKQDKEKNNNPYFEVHYTYDEYKQRLTKGIEARKRWYKRSLELGLKDDSVLLDRVDGTFNYIIAQRLSLEEGYTAENGWYHSNKYRDDAEAVAWLLENDYYFKKLLGFVDSVNKRFEKEYIEIKYGKKGERVLDYIEDIEVSLIISDYFYLVEYAGGEFGSWEGEDLGQDWLFLEYKLISNRFLTDTEIKTVALYLRASYQEEGILRGIIGADYVLGKCKSKVGFNKPSYGLLADYHEVKSLIGNIWVG